MIQNYLSLTLGTYIEIDKVLRSNQDELDQQVDIIALLSGKSREELLAMPLADYGDLAGKTNFLREPAPQVTAPSRVIVGDRVYIPTKDFTKITTAQYIDFQTFSKQGTDKLPELLAVLLIPEDKAYNEDYDFAQVVEDVKTLPLPVALALVGFFFASLRQSITASLTSLAEMGKKTRNNPKKQQEILAKVEKIRAQLAGAGLLT